MTIKITAFTKYGRGAASTRQRLLQYLPALEQAGFQVDYRPLLDDDYVGSLASGTSYPKARIAAAYFDRFRQLTLGHLGDIIWIYAELFPWFPAAFERLQLRRGRPIVYDFDDAFYHQYDDNPGLFRRTLLRGKLEPLLRAANACTCGNSYLRDYAAQFCENSIIVPTVVDTEVYRPGPPRCEHRLVIGWLGSPSTWNYVRPLLPVIERVCQERQVVFRAIGAGRVAESDRFPGMEVVEWTEASEVSELQRIDVGIMPLPDEQWARGKSGYKLIQYMACGLPVIGSAVGVNSEIIRNGKNGFVAANEGDWEPSLARLIADRELRSRMGESGRRRAVSQYSLCAHAPRIVEVFGRAAASTPR